MQISGQGALITGGASGLGLATARRLTAAGAHVTVIDLASSNGEEVAAELGGLFVPADVTSVDEVT
ncbi:SDR family NAD(P)-dependent oxidoreductase, partial [Mycobacterium tuberculosis]|uniref:SDR family NAD(P)-dependent oxidoreductase n=1 Tax=Mycobacterium tuberculosis TaxID=1773 RepID=UPI000A660835